MFLSLLQYEYLTTLYTIILLAIYIVYTIIEVIRLYIGYLGNLTERVSFLPLLSFEKLLSLFPGGLF